MEATEPKSKLSVEEVDACVRVLQAVAADRSLLADVDEPRRRALMVAAGLVSRPHRHERKQLVKAFRRQERAAQRSHDSILIKKTVNRSGRTSLSFVLPASTANRPHALPPVEERGELMRPRACYICKQDYRQVHHFYDSLCPACAELNYRKRFQTAPLDGRVILVTGARIKIGYQASLMLLRAGAHVIATTRFPRDAAQRFARETDFAEWSARLELHALELRHIPSVEWFARRLSETAPRLDAIINNAAQTVRRPPAFYQHLRAVEEQPLDELAPHVRPLLRGAAPDPAPVAALERRVAHDPAFPPGVLDLDEQQVDLRPVNSWRLTLGEVPTVELLEVHLVNAVAPFVLNSKLKPLMLRHRTFDKHIVNVSAMEAQFSRNKKTDKHPHTNMAKAALNMMTRTSAPDYAQDGIYMNSVDTGWITDEDPLVHVARKQVVHDFHPPLDAIDGAARILDPLFAGLNDNRHDWGLFFKDYRPVAW
jgi:NAD(P)-dependent dehydrogenase (short-subunit alcohol dehydrogenase family)